LLQPKRNAASAARAGLLAGHAFVATHSSGGLAHHHDTWRTSIDGSDAARLRGSLGASLARRADLRHSKHELATGDLTSVYDLNCFRDPLVLTDGQNSYIYGPDDLPIEQINAAGTPSYLHHDQLGSTRLITSQAGAAIGSSTYTAYGTPAAGWGAATTPLGYAGQYTDSETGFQYLRARYYDPNTDQFLTVDPKDMTTQERYAYVQDDPANYTDPNGEVALEEAPGGPSSTASQQSPSKTPKCGPGGPGEGSGGGTTIIPPFDFPQPEIPSLEPFPVPSFSTNPCPQQPYIQASEVVGCPPPAFVDGPTQPVWRRGV
jgi:RHS repeat-associated protein